VASVAAVRSARMASVMRRRSLGSSRAAEEEEKEAEEAEEEADGAPSAAQLTSQRPRCRGRRHCSACGRGEYFRLWRIR